MCLLCVMHYMSACFSASSSVCGGLLTRAILGHSLDFFKGLVRRKALP